jgi:hypothetical protein
MLVLAVALLLAPSAALAEALRFGYTPVFPEVEMLDQRLQMADLIRLQTPSFHVHSGPARNRSVVEGVEMLNFSSYNYPGF